MFEVAIYVLGSGLIVWYVGFRYKGGIFAKSERFYNEADANARADELNELGK